MPFSLEIIPDLVEKENTDKAHECTYDDDESRNSEKEYKSLSEITDEGDDDDPVNPCLGEGLKVSLDGFMELIEIFYDSDENECKCRYDSERHIFLIIDDGNFQLNSRDQIRKQTDSIHDIKYHYDDRYMDHWPQQTEHNIIFPLHHARLDDKKAALYCIR